MPGYKINNSNNKWYFELMPNNSNRQAIGKSIDYNSYEECRNAVYDFKSIVKINRINSIDSSNVRVNNKGHIEVFNNKGKVIYMSTNTYKSTVLSQVNKGIGAIYRHYDVEIREDI